LCPLTPLQAPNFVADQLPGPHHCREQLTVRQGNAAPAGKQEGGRKRRKKQPKCRCLIIQLQLLSSQERRLPGAGAHPARRRRA